MPARDFYVPPVTVFCYLHVLEGEKRGWGHGSWDEGVNICLECGVKQLILFHHDPDNDDQAIDALEKRAQARFPNTRAAYEGMEITL